jgi:hypothetical protein
VLCRNTPDCRKRTTRTMHRIRIRRVDFRLQTG